MQRNILAVSTVSNFKRPFMKPLAMAPTHGCWVLSSSMLCKVKRTSGKKPPSGFPNHPNILISTQSLTHNPVGHIVHNRLSWLSWPLTRLFPHLHALVWLSKENWNIIIKEHKEQYTFQNTACFLCQYNDRATTMTDEPKHSPPICRNC